MGTEPKNDSLNAIVRLDAGDMPRLEAMLADNALPADDCGAPGNSFYGIYDESNLVAAGGLESAGPYRLLRSVVVAAEYRGRGLAFRLVQFLLAQARGAGCHSVYLLTETAADYFIALGFEPVVRERVPPEIAATRQFTELCPDSAACLALPLSGA